VESKQEGYLLDILSQKEEKHKKKERKSCTRKTK